MGVMAKFLEPHAIANSFDLWWHSQGEWVEPANHRRGGQSGVQRLRQHGSNRTVLYCKRQSGHIYRSLLHPFGRPTILREQQAYRAFSSLGIKVPRLVFSAARKQQGQWQALLITEQLQGFISLEQWYASPIAQSHPALAYAVLDQLAIMLVRLHTAGWQHGCCYPKHLFVKVPDASNDNPQIETAMLDLEKSRKRWRTHHAGQRDMQQLYRHRGAMPEEHWHYLARAYQQHQRHPYGSQDL